MENKIPIAKEFANKFTTSRSEGTTSEYISSILIEFAQLHVKEALKMASKKAIPMQGAGERSYLYVDENSILNA